MKKLFYFAAACAAAIFASCSTQHTETDKVNPADLIGQWNLKVVALTDSATISPADIDPETNQTVTFGADSTVSFATNCNIVGGSYVAAGDSLTFGDMFATRMACPDMRVEDMLGKILPMIRTYNFENDSTLRLNSDLPAVYLLLTKAAPAAEE